jgi:hypothetical protein
MAREGVRWQFRTLNYRASDISALEQSLIQLQRRLFDPKAMCRIGHGSRKHYAADIQSIQVGCTKEAETYVIESD